MNAKYAPCFGVKVGGEIGVDTVRRIESDTGLSLKAAMNVVYRIELTDSERENFRRSLLVGTTH
jgi:hypothetical protein